MIVFLHPGSRQAIEWVRSHVYDDLHVELVSLEPGVGANLEPAVFLLPLGPPLATEEWAAAAIALAEGAGGACVGILPPGVHDLRWPVTAVVAHDAPQAEVTALVSFHCARRWQRPLSVELCSAEFAGGVFGFVDDSCAVPPAALASLSRMCSRRVLFVPASSEAAVEAAHPVCAVAFARSTQNLREVTKSVLGAMFDLALRADMFLLLVIDDDGCVSDTALSVNGSPALWSIEVFVQAEEEVVLEEVVEQEAPVEVAEESVDLARAKRKNFTKKIMEMALAACGSSPGTDATAILRCLDGVPADSAAHTKLDEVGWFGMDDRARLNKIKKHVRRE